MRDVMAPITRSKASLLPLAFLAAAGSVACLAVARAIPLPPANATSIPLPSPSVHLRVSPAPMSTREKDEGRSPLDPTPTHSPPRPTATSFPTLSQIPPGTYLITSWPEVGGFRVRTIEGDLAAYILGPESDPDWNARKQKLAFTQRTNRIGILAHPYLEVGELDYIPSGTTPSWSPDGGMFVYIYYSENPFELPQGLQLAYPAAHQTSPVPLPLRRIANPAWSPDDKWVAFVASETDELYGARLHVIDTICLRHPTSCEFTLWELPVSDEVDSARWPSWSPDDSKLAFECSHEEPSNLDICIFDFANWQTSFLTEGPDAEAQPRWSPDGTWIAYTDLDTRTIHLVSPDGLENRVVPTEGEESAAGWLVKYRR